MITLGIDINNYEHDNFTAHDLHGAWAGNNGGSYCLDDNERLINELLNKIEQSSCVSSYTPEDGDEFINAVMCCGLLPFEPQRVYRTAGNENDCTYFVLDEDMVGLQPQMLQHSRYYVAADGTAHNTDEIGDGRVMLLYYSILHLYQPRCLTPNNDGFESACKRLGVSQNSVRCIYRTWNTDDNYEEQVIYFVLGRDMI